MAQDYQVISSDSHLELSPDLWTPHVAAKWRGTRWWGVDIGDREIVVWGSPIELTTQDRFRHFRDRLLRNPAVEEVLAP